ncbi:MAG TPA: hypothetical protein VE222_11510 [Nitrospiraceae bacterium]|jgi:hypothetical protein|nr:hypothetical protein [Nitrospiraceae bacterium]
MTDNVYDKARCAQQYREDQVGSGIPTSGVNRIPASKLEVNPQFGNPGKRANGGPQDSGPLSGE